MPKSRNTCPVCGYPDLEEPAYDSYDCSSFEICECCGTEFGLHDKHATISKEDMHLHLRQQWAEAGFPWTGSVDDPPPNWDPREQLRKAGLSLES
jgi:hypothetical protein